jgi:hypothetical protein
MFKARLPLFKGDELFYTIFQKMKHESEVVTAKQIDRALLNHPLLIPTSIKKRCPLAEGYLDFGLTIRRDRFITACCN